MLSDLRRAAATSGDDAPAFDSLAGTLAAHLERSAGADGVLPAVLERNSPGFKSRILPAAEALIYPFYWLHCLHARVTVGTGGGAEIDAVIEHLQQALRASWTEALGRHTVALLSDPQRRNLFDDGGIKLSSTSNNSWMSKIALFQHVAREVLRLCDADASNAAFYTSLFSTADAAHVRWQTEGASAFWACSDQMVKGVAKASRYYPRLITAALWLHEHPRKAIDWTKTSAADAASPINP
jgi:hypothetical protein